MTSDTERREVARRLRDSGGRLIDMGELAEMLGFHRCSWSAGTLADRIADLIEPSEPKVKCVAEVKVDGEQLEKLVHDAAVELTGIDREEMLALADEMEQKADENRLTGMMSICRARSWADRIREALGVIDG